MVPVAGWKETQVSDMDFDTIMEKAYEEYFEGLAEGEEALSFSEFKRKRLVRTVLIFTESSDQLSRATDRVPGLPASPGYVQ